jgi:acetolactate synthase-1/2/3 large subunit
MGFGLPAAIGAALVRDGKKTVCVSGDGSLAMNVQELATLAELDLDVTIVVLNNAQLGMVRQQQGMFYGRRYSAARYAQRTDFAAVARAFGVFGLGVELDEGNPEATAARVLAIVERPGPALVEVLTPPEDDVLPVVPPGSSNAEMRGIDGTGS